MLLLPTLTVLGLSGSQMIACEWLSWKPEKGDNFVPVVMGADFGSLVEDLSGETENRNVIIISIISTKLNSGSDIFKAVYHMILHDCSCFIEFI